MKKRVMSKENWTVYIVRCSDDTLYTGITTDINRRLHEHNSGKGAKYTSSRTPVNLVWKEPGHDRSSALSREHEIKSKTRDEKVKLFRKN